MEPETIDTSVRVDAGVLNKLMSLAGELLLARDQFRAVCERTLVGAEAMSVPAEAAVAPTTLVLFSTPDCGWMAIPLSQVDGIAEFDADRVFREGRQRVVRHLGRLLPLVEVSSVLPERRARLRRAGAEHRSGGRLRVIVHRAGRRRVGLVVDQLLDVFEERLVLEQPGSRPGARASVVVRERVTELVDVDAMIRSVDAAFFGAPSAAVSSDTEP